VKSVPVQGRLSAKLTDTNDFLLHYYVMRSTRDVVDGEHYSDPPLLVLASLADGPKHGYAMIDEIEQMSGARLGPGTLYGQSPDSTTPRCESFLRVPA
jgi:hypothetical protein